MAGEIAPLGYQAHQPFWGSNSNIPVQSTWWNTDMSDAGQALYADPSTAVLAGTMPDGIIAANQEQVAQAQAYARQVRGGFMASLADALGNVDSALSNIPGWGVTKEALKTAWYPVDKLASGAYWLYSNAVSQPLSTLLLQSAKAEVAPGGFWENTDVLMSGDEWSDAYGKAEHISPAQAFMNYENAAEASGQGTLLSGALGAGADKLSAEQTAAAKRNTERFLYDTDFWRGKQGWTYTVGTGALDFTLSMGADPTYAGLKVVSAGVKAGRSTKIAGQATEASRSISGVNIAADKLGAAIGSKLAKTPEEASRSKKVNNFFDWANGKTAAEIAQHPIWGRSRRVNPARDALAQVFSRADRDDMPLIMRFAAGDNQAASEIVSKNSDLMIQLGKMQDNRVLVDSLRFDSELYASIAGTGRTDLTFPLLTQIPPKPGVGSSPERIAGWEKTYGKMAEQRALYEQAARQSSGVGVRGLGPIAQISPNDILRAEQWKASQLDLINQQVGSFQTDQKWFGDVMGSLATKVDDFSPGESNLFGTVKSMYRTGPLALRSAEKTAGKNVARLGAGRGDKFTDGGFATRLLRNGFYTPAIRVVQSFGERLPERFIDHNADDAYQRVAEMLKQVPGLGPEKRLDMIRAYSQAGDKVARAKVLDEIHTDVVNHMVGNVHGLDFETARTIDQMRKVGFQKTMMALTGNKNPGQMFSAAKLDEAGGLTQANRVDHVEDGEGYIIAPLAKTQLQAAEPLLPVREFDRLLKRNSGMLSSLKRSGGTASDNVTAALDSLSTVWKAATLLRPGYVLRSMSEEQVASAVKFGMMSSIMDLGQGLGVNWTLNRGQHVAAVVGKGSYTPSINKAKSIVRITDEAGLAAARAQGLQTERIRVSKAWPVIQARISDEREALAEAEKQIEKLKASKEPSAELIDDLTLKAMDHQYTIDEHVDYATAILQEAERATGRRLGEAAFEHQGIVVPEAFSKVWEHPIPRDQITSAHAMETIFARGEAIDNGRIIKTGSWKVITPDDPKHHMKSWLDGLNKQLRQDPLFQKVASDPTLKTARRWLKTPEGRYHMQQLGPRARDYDGTLNAIKLTLDQYLPEGTGLQEKLGRGEEILEPELRAAIAKEDFPPVHGEELRALTAMFSKQTAARAIDDIIEKGFRRLATIPNDIMARQPIYLRAQEARMRQLIDQELSFRRDNGLSEDLHVQDLEKLLNKSDKMARKDISQVVYDPTRTTATEALRFATPFLSAHIDGLQRWGGLVAESPQFLGTAAKVYNAPVAAGLITDQYGRPVDQNGTVEVVGEDGKKTRQFVPLEDRTLTIRNPEGTKNIKGVGKVKTGGVRISLSALNTILPGDPWFNPGTGPFAQVALSEVAKRSPALGDFMQWAKILPYGPSKGITDAFLPAYMKDAWDAYTAGDAGNENYQAAVVSEWQRQSAAYANGGPAPDWKTAEHNAKQFMYMDALKNWLSPTRTKETPLTQTPYQFFIDQYKTMQEVDPKNAQAQFFKKYGEDYFAFTASMSKSIGVQATLSAQHTAERYGDLIANDPDLAPLIVGDVYNQGKFSNSVYRKQMDTLLDGVQMREKITALDAIKENKKDLGWQQYSKYSDMIDAEMIRSGFHSYNQRGAEALAQVKQDVVSILAEQNPSWYESYGTRNTTQLPIRIEGMKRLVSDERIQADPIRSMDLAPLSLYLQQRDILKAQLAERGGSSLSFGPDGTPYGQNADIGMNLRTLQLYLVNNSIGFGDIFHRYLENDDLS